MTELLFIAAPLAMIGVVIALGLGLKNFSQEGADARRRSNKAMQWRIGLQFLAVALVMLILAVGGPFASH